MQEARHSKLLYLDETEDQLAIGVFICIIASLIFGLQPGDINTALWGVFGIIAFILIFFAFPNTWTYGVLLYAIYAISAFGVILLYHWGGSYLIGGLSLTILAAMFFFLAAAYMTFHIIQSIKETRDAQIKQDNYLPLGFWSIGVMLFTFFSILSILSWSIYTSSGGPWIQMYIGFESTIALLIIYILWIPDRNVDWTQKDLPQSPAVQFISMKTQVVKDKTTVMKDKVVKPKNICPECGMKLKIEKKTCPSCGNVQNFGWCVRSEAYALSCANCGKMALLGKETCPKCGKALADKITCNSCNKESAVKEWAPVT
jgi:hypothetical protein